MAEKYKVAKRGLLSPETLQFPGKRAVVFSAETPEYELELEPREAISLAASGHEVKKIVLVRKKAKRKVVEPDPEPMMTEKENENGA